MINRALARRPITRGRLIPVLSTHALTAPIAVGVLMLVAFAARVWLDRQILAPWVMVDELQYADMAKNFAAHGHYLFRDQPENVLSIYPALISPAWFAGSLHTTYTLVKVINAALMTLAAIPLYLWGRRLVPPLYAVLTVVLYLAIPSFVYTGEILTENAFAPAMLLAFFGLALALERPTILRQLLALALVGLAVSTRAQGLVLGLVVPTAIVLKLLLDLVAAEAGNRRRALFVQARRYWVSAAALVALVAAYVIYKAQQGVPLATGLGIYRSVAEVHYSVRDAARWIAYHFAELGFSVGLIPLSALVLLFALACRRSTAPAPAERAFLAVAASAVFWVVVEVGTFASRFSLRLEERYMFNLAPVLLLALVVWVARGLPRPPGATAVAALVPAALLLTLPYETFFTGALFNDTFGLIPLWRLTTRLGDVNETKALVGIGVLTAGLLFAAVPRRIAAWLVPAAVGGFLVLSSNSVFGTVKWLSAATRHAGGLSGDPSWIDHAIGRNSRAAFLVTTEIDRDQHVLWQSEFWNRSVHQVFGVTSQDPSIPGVTAPLDQATGLIVPQLPADSPDRSPRYAVVASDLAIAGQKVGAMGILGVYRVSPPLRLAGSVAGIEPDGWMGAQAAYTRYSAPRRARVEVFLSRSGWTGPDVPGHVRIEIGPVAAGDASSLLKVTGARTWTIHSNRARLFSLPAPRPPFRVYVYVSPTFSPSQFGSADTRQLGARVSFRLVR